MDEQYYLVHRSILPETYEKVVKARSLLENGGARDVSEAAKLAGISRSTYYKYKDYILERSSITEGRMAVLSAMLDHETGVLSALLSRLSSAGVNILSINQSMPVNGKAALMLTVDISEMSAATDDLVKILSGSPGTDHVKILAME